ncbi:Pentatricopeptide repeat-containing protein [Artemisia annua]|uniref:Pentatricopeptide repeat-containing protein n=1 Tax=Artemisia annua TaxID=35608 RepID=A0A2U1LQH7_ARTAN|nr:Pentatricopeptide repeat-containing protein [Artemisia annua]
MPSFHHHLTKLITTTITKYPSIKPTTLSFHTNPNTPPSHSQITKLISQQSDPLLAKEIFDLTLKTYPSYQHSYQTYHTLILKLARFRRFSQMDTLLTTLKNDRNCAVKPSLFTDIIRIYGEANMLDKVVNMFYKILEFDIRPRTKQLNVVLEILVRDRAYLRAAFDLFRCAYRYDVVANVETYNVLMRAFCLSGELSVAYKLFNEMFKRDIVPNVESYRILMQGLCRRSQVNRAVELLDDMLNKGFVPDCLSYTTVLNSLCRKKKLREAYKLLCRMKVKGCNPDIVHYNTVILGFCRENRALDACKVIEDMSANGCLPNLVSYRTLVSGLCSQGLYDEAKSYLDLMMAKGFSPHVSVWYSLINGLCNVGKIEDACVVLEGMLKSGEAPHIDTWNDVVSRGSNRPRNFCFLKGTRNQSTRFRFLSSKDFSVEYKWIDKKNQQFCSCYYLVVRTVKDEIVTSLIDGTKSWLSRNPLKNLYNHPFCDEMGVKTVVPLVSRRTGVNRSPVTTYYIVNGLIEFGKCSFGGGVINGVLNSHSSIIEVSFAKKVDGGQIGFSGKASQQNMARNWKCKKAVCACDSEL